MSLRRLRHHVISLRKEMMAYSHYSIHEYCYVIIPTQELKLHCVCCNKSITHEISHRLISCVMRASLLCEYSCHDSRVLNLLARPANGHLIQEVPIA